MCGTKFRDREGRDRRGLLLAFEFPQPTLCLG
jgi:hypothetical protein